MLPFAGLRYAAASEELARLISPPYDVIGTEELSSLQALSPNNISYVELPTDDGGRPGTRYAQAALRLEQWRRASVLKLEPRPAYYLSETTYAGESGTVRRQDVLAAVAVEPWSAGAVLPHEHTMSGPKADRLELLRATHMNSSPIWLLYRQQPPSIAAAWAVADQRLPDLDFTWRDERHRVWVVDDPTSVAGIQLDFESGGALYIADGHHRYETSLAFRAEAEAAANLPGAGATLAALTWAEDPGLLVLPTHRLLAGLDPALTLETLAPRWSSLFEIQSFPLLDSTPLKYAETLVQRLSDYGRRAPSFGLYGLGAPDQYSLLVLRDRNMANEALRTDRSDAWKTLDVSLLHALVIDPLLADTPGQRHDVLSYTRDPVQAVASVRQGQASLALFLNPTPVDGVLAVADAHDRMPEKSTYFHPKPPAGLVMRDLESAR